MKAPEAGRQPLALLLLALLAVGTLATPSPGSGAGGQAVVWTWSGGRMFAQVLSSLALAPRETRTYDIAWPLNDATGQPVGPGRYQVQIRFLGWPADPMNASGTIPPLMLLVE